MGFLLYSVFAMFIFVAVILILLILIQKGRGGGLAGAFGGAGGNTAFGSKTGDVLTWATSILFGVFLLLAGAAKSLSESVGKQPHDPQTSAAAPPPPPPPPRPPRRPAPRPGP